MSRTILTGIDIGTSHTRVVIVEYKKGDNEPTLIGAGISLSAGVRKGYIVNSKLAIESVHDAVSQAEKQAGIKIKKASLSVGGIGLSTDTAIGTATSTRVDNTITELDVERTMRACEEALKDRNKKVIHRIPLAYKLDSKPVLGDPVGMKGKKLEGRALFITCLSQHVERLVETVTNAGIEVTSIIASPVAAATVILSEKEKIAGTMLAHIGAETVGTVVYENGNILSLSMIQLGSADITNDIALGLKTSLEEAEGIKVGTVISSIPKKKIDEIIEARLTDIFELIEKHLKKIGRSALLPAGIIFTGGGSNLANLTQLAKRDLKLPSRIGFLNEKYDGKMKLKDSAWFCAYGSCICEHSSPFPDDESRVPEPDGAFKETFMGFLKQLLP